MFIRPRRSGLQNLSKLTLTFVAQSDIDAYSVTDAYNVITRFERDVLQHFMVPTSEAIVNIFFITRS